MSVRVTGRAMRGVKGLAAHCMRCGRSSLEAERVQEPEGDRMTAASKYGSPRKLPCGDRFSRSNPSNVG